MSKISFDSDSESGSVGGATAFLKPDTGMVKERACILGPKIGLGSVGHGDASELELSLPPLLRDSQAATEAEMAKLLDRFSGIGTCMKELFEKNIKSSIIALGLKLLFSPDVGNIRGLYTQINQMIDTIEALPLKDKMEGFILHTKPIWQDLETRDEKKIIKAVKRHLEDEDDECKADFMGLLYRLYIKYGETVFKVADKKLLLKNLCEMIYTARRYEELMPDGSESAAYTHETAVEEDEDGEWVDEPDVDNEEEEESSGSGDESWTDEDYVEDDYCSDDDGGSRSGTETASSSSSPTSPTPQSRSKTLRGSRKPRER